MARSLILMLTAWLVWTAATNTPLMRGIVTPAETWAWPVLTVLAGLWLAVAVALDALRGSRQAPMAAALVAAVTLALALRLWLLPIGAPAAPLALVGVREILTFIAACHAVFAAWSWRRPQPGTA